MGQSFPAFCLAAEARFSPQRQHEKGTGVRLPESTPSLAGDALSSAVCGAPARRPARAPGLLRLIKGPLPEKQRRLEILRQPRDGAAGGQAGNFSAGSPVRPRSLRPGVPGSIRPACIGLRRAGFSRPSFRCFSCPAAKEEDPRLRRDPSGALLRNLRPRARPCGPHAVRRSFPAPPVPAASLRLKKAAGLLLLQPPPVPPVFPDYNHLKYIDFFFQVIYNNVENIESFSSVLHGGFRLRQRSTG